MLSIIKLCFYESRGLVYIVNTPQFKAHNSLKPEQRCFQQHSPALRGTMVHSYTLAVCSDPRMLGSCATANCPEDPGIHLTFDFELHVGYSKSRTLLYVSSFSRHPHLSYTPLGVWPSLRSCTLQAVFSHKSATWL